MDVLGGANEVDCSLHICTKSMQPSLWHLSLQKSHYMLKRIANAIVVHHSLLKFCVNMAYRFFMWVLLCVGYVHRDLKVWNCAYSLTKRSYFVLSFYRVYLDFPA